MHSNAYLPLSSPAPETSPTPGTPRRHEDVREMDDQGGKRKRVVELARAETAALTDQGGRVSYQQQQHQHQQPPSWKKPRVKLERDRTASAYPGSYHRRDSSDSWDRERGHGNASHECATPRQARRARRWSSQPRALGRTGEEAGGGRGGGGVVVGGCGVDDPLAPYARIEAETWDDEGLEELLHGSRREGYLDLRRFRKPGWPRPLRVTRLEASHGKRYECDLPFFNSKHDPTYPNPECLYPERSASGKRIITFVSLVIFGLLLLLLFVFVLFLRVRCFWYARVFLLRVFVFRL